MILNGTHRRIRLVSLVENRLSVQRVHIFRCFALRKIPHTPRTAYSCVRSKTFTNSNIIMLYNRYLNTMIDVTLLLIAHTYYGFRVLKTYTEHDNIVIILCFKRSSRINSNGYANSTGDRGKFNYWIYILR